ncbi:GTP-binding protein [Xanthobacter autotrophicus DSM 597]|uniref:CobW family GTP-binding protein n=1 Tax=Xanthobacter wiegelii TaxID=3119913 RepID=UPI003726F748
MDERLPLIVVTGFLGSGKTTLIRRFIETPEGGDSGLMVNEFGEAGVDHRLLVHASEAVELIDGGCLCCARRSDVAKAMHDLVRMAKNSSRAGGGLRRAILETSGLADPAPVIATLARDPWLKAHVRLASVVAVVDAVAGLRNLENRPEARRQVAIADTVVITKGDMRAAEPTARLAAAVRAISPDARILDIQDETFRLGDVLAGRESLHAPPSPFLADAPEHDSEVSSFTLLIEGALDWPAFTLWLSALLHAHGDRILRVKGLLRTTSSDRPLAIHGVQHVMHPPTHLGADDGGPSFLVFIARGIRKAEIERSLARALDLCQAGSHMSDPARQAVAFREGIAPAA